MINKVLYLNIFKCWLFVAFSRIGDSLTLRALLFHMLVRVNICCITLHGPSKILVVEPDNPWSRALEKLTGPSLVEGLAALCAIRLLSCKIWGSANGFSDESRAYFRLSKRCSWGILFFWNVASVWWVKSINHVVTWWHIPQEGIPQNSRLPRYALFDRLTNK